LLLTSLLFQIVNVAANHVLLDSSVGPSSAGAHKNISLFCECANKNNFVSVNRSSDVITRAIIQEIMGSSIAALDVEFWGSLHKPNYIKKCTDVFDANAGPTQVV
jgi:hypothetical protein